MGVWAEGLFFFKFCGGFDPTAKKGFIVSTSCGCSHSRCPAWESSSPGVLAVEPWPLKKE